MEDIPFVKLGARSTSRQYSKSRGNTYCVLSFPFCILDIMGVDLGTKASMVTEVFMEFCSL
jgi:hypothetical protein